MRISFYFYISTSTLEKRWHKIWISTSLFPLSPPHQGHPKINISRPCRLWKSLIDPQALTARQEKTRPTKKLEISPDRDRPKELSRSYSCRSIDHTEFSTREEIWYRIFSCNEIDQGANRWLEDVVSVNKKQIDLISWGYFHKFLFSKFFLFSLWAESHNHVFSKREEEKKKKKTRVKILRCWQTRDGKRGAGRDRYGKKAKADWLKYESFESNREQGGKGSHGGLFKYKGERSDSALGCSPDSCNSGGHAPEAPSPK